MELNYKHTAERTHSPLMPLGVFDAVEASSADAGRLTLSQRIKRGGGGEAVAVLFILGCVSFQKSSQVCTGQIRIKVEGSFLFFFSV